MADDWIPHHAEPRAVCAAQLVIHPLPSNSQVWCVWDHAAAGQSLEADGPFEALFIGFIVEEYRSFSQGIERQYRQNVKGHSYFQDWLRFPTWSHDFTDRIKDGLDYSYTCVFVKADWENPWVVLGENAFWTESEARKTAAERTAANAKKPATS